MDQTKKIAEMEKSIKLCQNDVTKLQAALDKFKRDAEGDKIAIAQLRALIEEATVRMAIIGLDSTPVAAISTTKSSTKIFNSKNEFIRFAKDNLYGVRELFLKDIDFNKYFTDNLSAFKGLSNTNVAKLKDTDRSIVYKHMATKYYSDQNKQGKEAISAELKRLINQDAQETQAVAVEDDCEDLDE